jgi:FkbM family methyltransferase
MKFRQKFYNIFQALFGQSLAELLYVQYKRLEFFTGKQLPENDKLFIKNIERWIRPDSTVIDIGAYIGTWARTFSKMVGRNGRVIAFEPVPQNYNLLVKLCKHYKNIHIYNFALSDKNYCVEMKVPKNKRVTSMAAISHAANQMTEEWISNCFDIRCDAKRLDNIISPDTKISLIKCDVEGHELQVMRGAEILLLRDRPVVVIEILKKKWKDNSPLLSDVAKFMINLGYEMGQFVDRNIVYSDFNSNSVDFLFRPVEETAQ